MAEIEFKRRGTPLWAVVLVLLVVVAIGYFVFGRGNAGSPVSDSVAATPAPAAPGAPAPGPGTPAAPAPAAAPPGIAGLASWVDATTIPATAGEAQRTTLAEGLRRLASALEQRSPMSGVQILLIRSMADTLVLPNPTANQQINAVQAAFFAAAYALRDAPAGDRMNRAASTLLLTKSISDQRAEIREYFEVARDAMRAPPGAAASAAPPKAKS